MEGRGGRDRGMEEGRGRERDGERERERENGEQRYSRNWKGRIHCVHMTAASH